MANIRIERDDTEIMVEELEVGNYFVYDGGLYLVVDVDKDVIKVWSFSDEEMFNVLEMFYLTTKVVLIDYDKVDITVKF